MAVHDNVKVLREIHSYTQEYIANILGISRYWYGQLESGQYEMKRWHLGKLSDLYNIPISNICDYDRQKIKLLFKQEAEKRNSGIKRKHSDITYDEICEKYEAIINSKNDVIERLKEENNNLMKMLEWFQKQGI